MRTTSARYSSVYVFGFFASFDIFGDDILPQPSCPTNRGKATSAQSLAMLSTGVMIRQRETRRDDIFTR